MTPRYLRSVQNLARTLGRGVRAESQRVALMAVAGVIGATGCGFVVFAAYRALRLVVAPEVAALGIGIALLALAGAMARLAQGFQAGRQPIATLPIYAPSQSADPTIVVVFTAAFVLGRRLADRWHG